MAATATKEKVTKTGRAAASGNGDASAGTYMREALAQWTAAAKLGAAATLPSVRTAAAGRGRRAAGAIADWALSKLGPGGKLASKLSLGSRSLGDGPDDDEGSGDEDDTEVTIPIQEGITVAVPVGLAYQLATAVDDFPNFLEHVVGVEARSDSEVDVTLKLHGARREATVEIFDTREEERIDWRSTDGIEHAGTVSFHELAPRLTRIELSIDVEPQGLVQRLSRATHLSDHAVANELRRFKAYAELYEGDADEEFEPEEIEDEDADVEDEEADVEDEEAEEAAAE